MTTQKTPEKTKKSTVVMGKTGVEVSALCFGTMSFGSIADDAMSQALYIRCRDAGINHFDTADVYSRGVSETMLGQFIKGHRDEVILASKAYFPTGRDPNARGSSRYHLVRAVEASLKRLATDRIDIYYLHRFDEMTDLEDSLRTLEDLRRQGKILYPAASNFSAWQVAKALGIAALRGWAPLACVQPMYNLVKRMAEVEILPMARSEQVAVFPYSPLGGGLLSGKYGVERRPETGRLLENKMYQVRYGDADVYRVAEEFTSFATRQGYHPAALAVAWVAAQPGVTAPIIGARNLGQLDQVLTALDIELTPSELQNISQLSTSPPPATDRNEEKTEFNYGQR